MEDRVLVRAGLLRIGIWNGAEEVSFGKLLSIALLEDALEFGIRGGTATPCAEGSRGRFLMRSAASEVTSNNLPVWLEFVDEAGRLSALIPVVKRRLRGRGILTTEPCIAWCVGGGSEVETEMKFLWDEARRCLSPEEHRTLPAGLQIRLYTVENRQIGGLPVYQAVGEFLRSKDVLWVSTTRGLYGFGEARKIRRSRWWRDSGDTPIVITAIDTYGKLMPLVQELADFVGEAALVTITPTHLAAVPQDCVQPEKYR